MSARIDDYARLGAWASGYWGEAIDLNRSSRVEPEFQLYLFGWRCRCASSFALARERSVTSAVVSLRPPELAVGAMHRLTRSLPKALRITAPCVTTARRQHAWHRPKSRRRSLGARSAVQRHCCELPELPNRAPEREPARTGASAITSRSALRRVAGDAAPPQNSEINADELLMDSEAATCWRIHSIALAHGFPLARSGHGVEPDRVPPKAGGVRSAPASAPSNRTG